MKVTKILCQMNIIVPVSQSWWSGDGCGCPALASRRTCALAAMQKLCADLLICKSPLANLAQWCDGVRYKELEAGSRWSEARTRTCSVTWRSSEPGPAVARVQGGWNMCRTRSVSRYLAIYLHCVYLQCIYIYNIYNIFNLQYLRYICNVSIMSTVYLQYLHCI